jgi:hypothetical protein
VRAKVTRLKFATLDGAAAVAEALEEKDAEEKAEDKRQNKIRAFAEKEARKRESSAAKQLKEEERQRAKEKQWIESEVKRKMCEIDATREARRKANEKEDAQQRKAAAKVAEEERQALRKRLGPQKVAAVEKVVARFGAAIDAWQVRLYGDAWEKWMAVVLANRAKASLAKHQAQQQAAEEEREKRRAADKQRAAQKELRLRGDVEAIAEFDARVAIVVDRGAFPKLAQAYQAGRQRRGFGHWKQRAVANLEAGVWKRCVSEFTRKHGFPPKPGSLRAFSPASAELLGEPKPAKVAAAASGGGGGKDAKVAAAAAAAENRKALKGASRDARKLAKIRDKLEAKEPPTGLLQAFLAQARPEKNWRAHVGGDDGDGGDPTEGEGGDKGGSGAGRRRRRTGGKSVDI